MLRFRKWGICPVTAEMRTRFGNYPTSSTITSSVKLTGNQQSPFVSMRKHASSKWNIQQQHFSASSSNTGSKNTLKDIPTPSDVLKRQAFIREKAARAQTIHSELEQLLANRVKRQEAEMKKGPIQRASSFLYQNNGRLLNVGAALAMVLLAYQLVLLRDKQQKALKEATESAKKLEERGTLLKSLLTEEFCNDLASEIVKSLKEEEGQAKKKSESWRSVWSYSQSTSEADVGDDNDQDTQSRVAILISRGLSRQIGGEGLSEQEQKERVLNILKAQQQDQQRQEKDEQDSTSLLLNAIVKTPSPSHTLTDQPQKEAGGEVVHQKRVFSI